MPTGVEVETAVGDSVDVVNTPTYIPHRSGSLFGVISMQQSSQVRGAVIVLPSLAKEVIHTTRALKLLSETLAAHGFLALRIDYANTGESAGDQRDPLAAEHWVDSIRTAVSYVRSLGIRNVTVVGHRVGSLLATQDVDLLGQLDAIVLWDPVVRGRHFVRMQKALYSIVTAESDGLPDSVPLVETDQSDNLVHLMGLTLHSAAAKSLSGMRIDSAALDALPKTAVLALLRDSELESDLAQSIRVNEGEVSSVGDQTDFLEAVNPWVVTLPDEVETIASWIGRRVGDNTPESVEVRSTSSAVVAHTSDGQPIETIVRVLPGNRIVWDTALVGRHTAARHVVVTHTIAHDIRTGPDRLFYDLAIDVAGLEGRVVRFDRAGVGESGHVSDEDTHIRLYKRPYIDEGLRILDAIELPDNATIVHTGVCIGGWMASHAAIESRRRFSTNGSQSGAVIVNPLRWRLRPPVSTGIVERRHRVGFDVPTGEGGESGLAKPTTAPPILRVFKAIDRNVVRRLVGLLPEDAYTVISRSLLARNPDSLVNSIYRAGASVRIVFGPEDYQLFCRYGGPQGFEKRGWRVPIYVGESGDHVGYSATIHKATMQACRDALGLKEPEKAPPSNAPSH